MMSLSLITIMRSMCTWMIIMMRVTVMMMKMVVTQSKYSNIRSKSRIAVIIESIFQKMMQQIVVMVAIKELKKEGVRKVKRRMGRMSYIYMRKVTLNTSTTAPTVIIFTIIIIQIGMPSLKLIEIKNMIKMNIINLKTYRI